MINPQLFLDLSANVIQHTLHNLMIKGISYTKIGTADYEMHLFDDENLTVDLDAHFHEVKNQNKTIYATHIPLDSSIESSFAKDCETNEQVEFYFKLPTWFKIPTPIGNYNPDWALIFKDEKKIYFVAETKDKLDPHKLRQEEAQKIHCSQKHFEIGDSVEYRHVTKLSDIIG